MLLYLTFFFWYRILVGQRLVFFSVSWCITAFSQGGWLLSIGSMVLVFVIGYLASINVAEACARAETWTRFLQERLRREEELDKQEEEEEEDIEAASQHHNKKRRNITINLDVFRCSDSGHTGATMDVIGHDLFNVAEDTSSCSVLSDEELLDNDDDDASPQNNKVRNEEDAFPTKTENSSASKIIRTTKSMDTADETIQDSMHDNSNTKIITSYYYCGYQQKDSFESDEQQFNSDGSNSSSNNSPLSVSDNDDDNNSDKSLPPRAILHVSTGGREAPRGVKEAVRQWDAPTIGERKFELTDLSRVFLGGHLSVFFTTTTALELFGGTWALGAIFGSSFATEVPIDSLGGPDQSYYLYVAVFAILATALSSMPSVVDQLSVQLCFLGLRMVMLVLMILTVVVAWSSGVPHFDDATPSSSSSWGVSGVPLVNLGRLHVILQISIWSTGYQFAVPAVASTARDKRRALSIIHTAVLFILVTTLVLSLLLSFYFGPDNMQVSSNLNWSTYHGGTGYLESDDGGIPLCCRRRGVAWWARIIGTFIVLYPAVDGIGVFSLSAVSLSELVMGFWCKDALQDWKKRTLFRLLGSLPQLVCALFVKDLSVM